MKKIRSMSTEKLYKLFIYVALITLAISILVPVVWVFLASIKENPEFYGNPWAFPKGIHWQNFVDAWQTAKMGEYFLTSVYVTAMALIILLVTAIPLAYVVSRFEFRLRKPIKTLMMAGLFVNVNYIVIPIFLMLLQGDRWLIRNEIVSSSLFLNNHIVLALVYAATAIPFTTYLLMSYFESIPRAYEEAAWMDGSTNFQTMMRVMIPMAKPSIITVILFNFMSFWNEYIISLTLLPNTTATLPVGLIRLMQVQRSAANYGPMYAGLVIVMLPTLIIYILLQKRLTEGMTVGGLKG
ncbi:MAG: carbohydrate ABC transporter permease [Erysipelothrix sp.]|nr:carbohydrate ABC transporter permease [Erysipelothrix sp.]